MNIIYCTFFDLDQPSPGLNRIIKLRNSLKLFNINIIIAGSSTKTNNSKYDVINNLYENKVIFNQKLFYKKKISKFLSNLSASSKFYQTHLDELKNKLNLSGAIIYSPFGKIVKPILSKKNKDFFIIADCGEYYDFSLHNFLNGILFQQFIFKYMQFKKLDGAFVPSPIWYKKAISLKVKRIYVPGLVDKSMPYRKKISYNKKIKIVIMGRLINREIPLSIFRALKICIKEGIDFEFIMIGNKFDNSKENKWLNILRNKFKDLLKKTKTLGYISDELKGKILSEADVFIMLRPTCNETKHLFPSRVPELLFTANPIIMTKTSSLDFFFKDGNGIIFIDKNNFPKDLAGKIILMANNPKLRFELGQKGRLFAKEHFSEKKIGNKLSNFLRKFN